MKVLDDRPKLRGGLVAALCIPLAFGAPHRASAQESQARPLSVRFSSAVIARNPIVYPKWDYTAGVVLLAIGRVADAEDVPSMRAYVKSNIDRLVSADGAIATYNPDDYSLDQIAEGRVLLALARNSADARYRKAATLLRNQLRTHPRTEEGGFWHKKIYPQQMWLDGLYMAGPFYAEYASTMERGAARDSAFSDVTRQFLLAARHLRDPRTGLMYHGWDATRSQKWADTATGTSATLWGRGIGWYLTGLVETLDYLPKTHPDRPELIRILNDLSAAVAKVQDPVTGLWWQVLDQPNRKGNYLEASASSMFVYSLAKAARLGYIPAAYRGVAQRGLDGIYANLVKTAPDGRLSLTNICQTAGLGGVRKDGVARDGSYSYYVTEPVVADDYKGVGPLILAALELGE